MAGRPSPRRGGGWSRRQRPRSVAAGAEQVPRVSVLPPSLSGWPSGGRLPPRLPVAARPEGGGGSDPPQVLCHQLADGWIRGVPLEQPGIWRWSWFAPSRCWSGAGSFWGRVPPGEEVGWRSVWWDSVTLTCVCQVSCTSSLCCCMTGRKMCNAFLSQMRSRCCAGATHCEKEMFSLVTSLKLRVHQLSFVFANKDSKDKIKHNAMPAAFSNLLTKIPI